MELTIERDSLLRLTTLAQGVVPKKSTKPILNHMLVEAHPDKGLIVTATDEQLSSQGVSVAMVVEAGAFTVSANDLHNIVKNLPPGPVTLSVKEGQDQVEINSARIHFKLHTLPAEEFPSFANLVPQQTFELPAKELSTLFDKTLFAVSHDESRYYLGGVFIESIEDKIRAVATDGHRLALAECNAPKGFVLKPGKILPRKLLAELPKMLDDKEGHVTFGFLENKVLFTNGSQTLISLLIDGTFPDYRPVIPASPNMFCRVGRVELLNALRLISLLSPDKMGGVRVEVRNKMFKISSQHSGRGTGVQTVDVYEGGGDLEIGFNSIFCVDALNSYDTPDVLLEFTDKQNPCLVKPFHDDLDDEIEKQFMLNVIMPMRL